MPRSLPVALVAAMAVIAVAAITTTASSPATQTGGAAAAAVIPEGTVASVVAAGTANVLHSVASFAGGVALSGDFRGNGASQVAMLQDPSSDLGLRITLLERGAADEQLGGSSWYASGRGSFDLARAKWTAVDVTGDGKDDLVALYSDGALSARFLVFRSTGTGFDLTGTTGWWRSDGYAWSRVQALLGGTLREGGPATIVSVYQYDNFQVRMHSFESTGSAFAYAGNQGIFDSGPGQYDARQARFLVGRFTRSSGPDQIGALYQYPGFRVRLHVFDPTPAGLVRVNGWMGVYDSGEGQYDLARASISAADADGDGRTDLFSLYSYADGSARLHVFDAGAGFRASFMGAANVPTGLVCSGASGFVAGDWDGDHRSDGAALTFVANAGTKTSLLLNGGAAFRVSAATDVRCDRWPLTGLVSNGARMNVRPLYVKIDNSPSARPHYGIGRADMVIEWLVEGFTTRLGAIFHSQDPDEVGSIRSGRHTDRPVAPAFRGAIVYSGAAGEETEGFAYDQSQGRYVDLNAGYFGWSYRVGFRSAPYNMFTTGARIREAIRSTGIADPVSVPPWDFLATTTHDPVAGGLSGSVAATSLTIPYRSLFGVQYAYDAAARTYARWQSGTREVDGGSGQPIAARNIVVIQTDVELTDKYGRDAAGSLKVDMRLTGTGSGIIFRDGRRQAVTWTRPDIFDPYTLTTAAGEKVFLAPGQTWIHIIPKEWTVPSE